MSKERVIEVARGEIGQKESPPGSNKVKYWDDFDPRMQGQPWCVAFLYSVFLRAGERMAFFGGGKTASCSMLLRWYREQGLTVPVSEVQPGDIVILNFHGTRVTEHCGLVIAVDGIYITTVEGNTSEAGSQSNGGAVCKKTRFRSQIVDVCRPRYTEEVEPVDDIKGHWAEQAIRRCIRRGLIKGYPDGSWKPDQPVTRAELAVILDRLDEDKEDDLK